MSRGWRLFDQLRESGPARRLPPRIERAERVRVEWNLWLIDTPTAVERLADIYPSLTMSRAGWLRFLGERDERR
jgi:hypothetical protein